ncbi:MAG: DUF2071 domain-containing protein [Verrucomicrobiales bacterium]|nr:DUF2071 domain-containing protein [Verrucomicrobiales bacterium]
MSASQTSPTLEDRQNLTRRPEGRTHVMYQSWQKLLFLHWKVDVDEIQKMLPSGLKVDTFEGQAYVGVVPFYMRHIRPRFLPTAPWISNFLELNVRTYVHDEKGQPGVWFFSLDTNRALAAYLGQRFFCMPYTQARMQAEQTENGEIQYCCLRKGSAIEQQADYRYRGTGDVFTAEPGTLEYFLAERYLLFASDTKREKLYTGRVYHPPYPLQKVELSSYSMEPIKQAGISVTEQPPANALYSEGVDVIAYPLRRVG